MAVQAAHRGGPSTKLRTLLLAPCWVMPSTSPTSACRARGDRRRRGGALVEFGRAQQRRAGCTLHTAGFHRSGLLHGFDQAGPRGDADLAAGATSLSQMSTAASCDVPAIRAENTARSCWAAA